MAIDKIGYKNKIQNAMRKVMQDVLKNAAENGLPGDHHFYITFDTKADGVVMADHLRKRFAEDMTIVIQHQYWDLEALDTHFEIILKFSGIPQHLRIPYLAVTRFVDPSINFSLSFESVPSLEEPPEMNTHDATDHKAHMRPASDGTVVSLDSFRRK